MNRDNTFIVCAFVLTMLLGFGMNYVFVVVPEQRDREATKAAFRSFILGEKGQAAMHLSGNAIDLFQPVGE